MSNKTKRRFKPLVIVPILYGFRTTLGNGLTTSKTYDYGFPLNTTTPGVQNLTTNFDIKTGNLESRSEVKSSGTLNEDFTYDNLNRLTSSTASLYSGGMGQVYQTHTTTYDQAGGISQGNIVHKTDVGSYSYGYHPRHSVTYVDNAANNVSKWTQDITYTAFRMAEKVTETDNQSSYNFEQEFTYNPSYDRVKTVLKENGAMKQTRYYLDGFEYNLVGNNYVYYVPGGDGLCAIVEQCPSITAPTYALHYVYQDHLGSIVAVTDGNGNIEAEQSFDAWGRFRNPAAITIRLWVWTGCTGAIRGMSTCRRLT